MGWFIAIAIVIVLFLLKVWWEKQKFQARTQTVQACSQLIKGLLEEFDIDDKQNIHDSVYRKTVSYILDHKIDAPSNSQQDQLLQFIIESIQVECLLRGKPDPFTENDNENEKTDS